MKKLLLSTGDKYLVESANYDPIFGINLWQYKQGSLKGRMIDDVTFDVHPCNWVGANLLGISLMEVREKLRNQDCKILQRRISKVFTGTIFQKIVTTNFIAFLLLLFKSGSAI